MLMAASAFIWAGAHAQSDLLSTVQDWTGSGTNEAAMEIDWNQGTPGDAMLWGYRWNGAATGEQMLEAIVAGDPRLFAELNGFNTGYGDIVFGLGFSATGDEPIQLSPSLSFNSQHLAYADSYAAVEDNRTAMNPGDLWQEGWNSAGYWSYWVSTDGALTAAGNDPSAWSAAWSSSSSGFDSTYLENGDVNGWIFDFDFAYPGPTPAIPIAVAPAPEPSTWAMLGLGLLGLGFAKRQWNQTKKSAGH